MAGAVVFDLDGVLIDSEPFWLRIRREVVAEFGGTWRDDADHRLLGMNTSEWAAYLVDELGVRLTAGEVARIVIERMKAAYASGPPEIDGAAVTVRALGDAGLPLAVASSSPRTLIEAVVGALGLADTFRVLVSSDEVEHGKPAPDVYLTAVERLGVPVDTCAAVEDSPNGIRAAVAAGLAVLAIPADRTAEVPDGVRVLQRVEDVTPELIASL